MGARVNGRLVPLDSSLENGDVVEVIQSRLGPAVSDRDWMTFVKSPRARNKIRQWFSKERREEAIERGNAAIGKGQASAATVVHRLVQSMGGESGTEEDVAETDQPGRQPRVRTGDAGVVVKGVTDIWAKLAKCCTPVPGDEIMGFVTRGAGVSVHRVDCRNVEELRQQPERIVEVEWDVGPNTLFLVQIQVEALDRSRLLSDVTRVLSDHHVNILSATVSTTRDRVAMSRFIFEMADPAHLTQVLAAVR